MGTLKYEEKRAKEACSEERDLGKKHSKWKSRTEKERGKGTRGLLPALENQMQRNVGVFKNRGKWEGTRGVYQQILNRTTHQRTSASSVVYKNWRKEGLDRSVREGRRGSHPRNYKRPRKDSNHALQ